MIVLKLKNLEFVRVAEASRRAAVYRFAHILIGHKTSKILIFGVLFYILVSRGGLYGTYA